MTDLTKELKRRTIKPLLHYKKPIVIELLPGDVIRLRLLSDVTGPTRRKNGGFARRSKMTGI